jgi:hypothetical protein
MPKVSATPAMPTTAASTDQPCPSGPTIALSAAIVPRIASPSAMITIRP